MNRVATDATTTAYHALGDKTTVAIPVPDRLSGHETATYAYEAAGQLTSVTGPPTSNSGGASNEVTDDVYDVAGELLTTTTGAGTVTAATTCTCYDLGRDPDRHGAGRRQHEFGRNVAIELTITNSAHWMFRRN